jgi:hypothetical protein
VSAGALLRIGLMLTTEIWLITKSKVVTARTKDRQHNLDLTTTLTTEYLLVFS